MYTLNWLHNTPTQNQMEFFHALGKHPEVLLKVFNCSAKFPVRPFALDNPWIEENSFSFEHRILRGWNIPTTRFRETFLNPEILRFTAGTKSDEIWLVGGYTLPTVQLAMWDLTRRGKNWILVSEPPENITTFRHMVRTLLLAPVSKARGVIVYGSARRAEYFRKWMPARRICVRPQYQNLTPFSSGLQRRSSTPGMVHFLYAGRIEQFSGVDTVIRCFNVVGKKFANVKLTVLGEGSARNQAEQLVAPEVRSRVTFLGNRPRSDVPKIFQSSNVFVHANHGQGWGMVVNEALASGLPVISSRAIGSAEALISEGYNGFLLNSPTDELGFTRAMEFFAENVESLDRFEKNAQKTAENLSLDSGVAEFINTIRSLTSRLT